MEKMHGEYTIKFVSAQQARIIYKYRNTKEKLLRTNASIWFNKTCKAEHLQPRYINIKVNGNNRRSHNTKNAALKYRIDLELKHLYKKNAILNKQLYDTHLKCANYWQELWYLIERSEHQKCQNMNDMLYNKLNKKLDSLRHTQIQVTKQHGDYNTETNITFYTRVKNMSNI
jgi:hypothetical protein